MRHELREYEVDPDDLTAEPVAAKVGLSPRQVFMTLVARRPECHLLRGRAGRRPPSGI